MIRILVLKHLPGAGKSKRGGSKGNVREGATAKGAMDKGKCVRVIEGEEVRKDFSQHRSIELFVSCGVGRNLFLQWHILTQIKPQRFCQDGYVQIWYK